MNVESNNAINKNKKYFEKWEYPSFLLAHPEIIWDNNIYYCKEHNKSCNSISNIKRHVDESHSKNPYTICEFCLKKEKRITQHYKFCKKKRILEKKENNDNNNEGNHEQIINSFFENNELSVPISSNIKKDDILNCSKLIFNSYNNMEELVDDFCQYYDGYFNPKILKYKALGDLILGKGSFGICCFGLDENSKKPCAIKVALEKNDRILKKESLFLEEFFDIEFLPRLFSFEGSDELSPYLAEELMGPNLRKLYEFCDRRIDVKTLCNIGIDIISSINAIHHKNIVHCDIKPTNICWNVIDNRDIYPELVIIDYGLCTNLKKVNEVKYKGNKIYASIEVLDTGKISKKDEIISILYILFYLYKGSLPWKSYNNKNNKKSELLKKKKEFNFIKELPDEIKDIGKIYLKVQQLEKWDEPDYFEYQKILNELKNKNNNDNYECLRFIWDKKILELFKEANELKNPAKIKEKIYENLFAGYPEKFVNFVLNKRYSKIKNIY